MRVSPKSEPSLPREHQLSLLLQRKPSVGRESLPLPAGRVTDTTVLLPQGSTAGAGLSGLWQDRWGLTVGEATGPVLDMPGRQKGGLWLKPPTGAKDVINLALQVGFSILPSFFP